MGERHAAPEAGIEKHPNIRTVLAILVGGNEDAEHRHEEVRFAVPTDLSDRASGHSRVICFRRPAETRHRRVLRFHQQHVVGIIG